MLALIIFILILSVLVLIHEFGHFYVAKKNGIDVEEFGYGLPPKIWGKKFGDTEYTINLLPFGGFVRIRGEGDLEASDDPKNFNSKTPLQRAAVLIAGVFMNTVLAIFVYYVFFFITGFKTLTIPVLFPHDFKGAQTTTINNVITGYVVDSAAEEAGVNVGEAITKVDGVEVFSVDEIKSYIADKEGESVNVTLVDVTRLDLQATERVVSFAPRFTEEENEVLLGVSLTEAARLDYSNNKFFAAPLHAYNMLSYTKTTLGGMINLSREEGTAEPIASSVSGPVGIFAVVDGILDYSPREAILGLLDLTALLSLSLAFMNLLPFPALDGGRLIFVIYEWITKKRVSAKFEAALHKYGMLFLLLLIVLVTFKDIRFLFGS